MFNWHQAAVALGVAQGETDHEVYGRWHIDLPHNRLPRLAIDSMAFCPADVRHLAVDTFERSYERRRAELEEDEAALDPFEDDLAVSA